MAFKCSVVTPERQAFDAAAKQVILPAHDGLVGILTDRAPLLIKLGIGPMRVDQLDGQTKLFFIDGGIAQMHENELTVLTSEATLAENVDPEAAQAAYAEAAKMPVTDEASRQARERAIERARQQKTIAGQR
jgi:F-type H+-transporting ATPase subunit epsilon